MSERTTSHAKSVTVGSEADSILAKYGYLQNTFDHARDPLISRQLNEQSAANTGGAANQGRASWMVEREQPRPLMQPPEVMAREQNRATHAERMAEDDASASNANRVLEKYGLDKAAPASAQSQSNRSHLKSAQ